MDELLEILLFLAAIGSGIVAGIFFIFSVCVMKALSGLPAPHGIAAMQSINLAILNPAFLLVFLGTAILSAFLAVSAAFGWLDSGRAYTLLGSIAYLVGALVITMLFNVPRNDDLAEIDPNGARSDERWRRYVSEWTAGNHLRTLATVIATAAFVLAVR